ncbi:unnamed protein product [Ilex paraguariensis]|uniref:Uncharacterized protein n=1 Tax=Ilex paraguariensis TaxID=185542 RepID=A0ABC8RD88_9AQUA
MSLDNIEPWSSRFIKVTSEHLAIEPRLVPCQRPFPSKAEYFIKFPKLSPTLIDNGGVGDEGISGMAAAMAVGWTSSGATQLAFISSNLAFVAVNFWSASSILLMALASTSLLLSSSEVKASTFQIRLAMLLV